jgi:tetratricopeptide (TPR) repeat protein
MSSDPSFLQSDPKRQAVPTLRGFSYQIWHGVYRWLTLQEDEALFLEGAEDINVLGPGRAETVQVKDTKASGTVTLRSQDVLSAVAHFWEHQRQNAGLLVTFRFLTTAERGLEQPSPFGDRRGLDYWDSCKYPSTDLGPLKSFLLSQTSLPQDLRAFVAAATDGELRERLIRRIEWDTGSKPQPSIEDLVNRRVEAYGARVYGLPPSDSLKIVPHLLQHVWEVVTRQDGRRLDYSDFIRVFEEATTERVSRHELQYLRRMAMLAPQAGGGLVPAGLSGAVTRSLPAALFGAVVPPFTDRLVPRRELVADLLSRLNANGILALRGSTGMGKSTLAGALATADGASWRVLDLRGRSPEQISDLLLFVTQAVEDYPGGVDYVIDDLNFDSQTSLYENALARFIYAVRLRNGRVVITTQGLLPSRIVNMFDVPPACVVDVPALTEVEIKELAANYGCPPEGLGGWGRIIYLKTGGHPQLADALARNLEAKGWPAHTFEDLVKTEDLQEVKAEARNRLRDTIPSEEARRLAYRLSVFSQRFRRSHALRIGQHPPGLSTPGEAFDSLVGPWVERVDGQHFRLSQLLGDVAREVLTEQEVKELHGAVAETYLSERTIDLLEYSAVLLHGMLGEAQRPLVAAAMGSFQVEEEHWPEFSRVLDWFGHCGLESGKRLFSRNDFVNFLLRRLQFKIVAEVDSARALRVAAIWEQEIEDYHGEGLHPSTQPMMRFGFLQDVLVELRVPFPMRAVVSYLTSLTRIVPMLRDTGALLPGPADYLPEERAAAESRLRAVATVENYVRFAVVRCRTGNNAAEFLAALDELASEAAEEPQNIQKQEAADKLWEVFRRDDYLCMMLIDGIWIEESNSPAPDWARCIRTLEGIIELGFKRDATALAVAAYRGKAIVQEEYLKDAASALATIAEAEARIGRPHLLLEDYRAKILIIEKDYSAALEVWEDILPKFDSEQNPARTFSYRDAEICAARMGDWAKAADFALRGEAAALRMLSDIIADSPQFPQVEVIAAGFKADLAFARWKLGDQAGAVKLFSEILSAFDRLPDPRSDIKAQMLYRRVAYGIAWMRHDRDTDEKFEEPAPGFFSNPEVVEEVTAEPLPLKQNVWYVLARLEDKLNLGDEVFRRLEEEVGKSGGVALNVGYGELRLKHLLRSMRLEDLVQQFMEYSFALKGVAERAGRAVNDWPHSYELKRLLFAALVRLVGNNQYASVPVSKWREDASKYPELDDSLPRWFDFMEKGTSASTRDLASTLIDETVEGESRLVAALLLSASDETSVEERFRADVTLTITDMHDPWADVTGEVIGSIVSRQWAKVASEERFALRFPTVNSITIKAACDDISCGGLRKVARIMLAAKTAVRTSLSPAALAKLEERAL